MREIEFKDVKPGAKFTVPNGSTPKSVYTKLLGYDNPNAIRASDGSGAVLLPNTICRVIE